MGVRYSLSLFPSFVHDEQVLVPVKRVWFASFKSLPSYRVTPCVPVLCDCGLCITNRRVLLVGHVLRCFATEVSQWFGGRGERGDDEAITEVRVGRNRVWGAYLETVSEDPRKRWYRSARLRMRLYVTDPEPVCQAIAEIMAARSQES